MTVKTTLGKRYKKRESAETLIVSSHMPKKAAYQGFRNAKTGKPWHTDLKDADLERMLEHLEGIANAVELAVDAICEKLGVALEDDIDEEYPDTEEYDDSSPESKE